MENVQALSDEMAFTKRPHKLLIDTYSEAIVEEYSLDQILEVMNYLKFEKAKVIISGQNVLDKHLFGKPLSAVMKETYMKTKYQLFQKPILGLDSKNMFKLPHPNPLIPENFNIFGQS